jgi:hypothetical protein
MGYVLNPFMTKNFIEIIENHQPDLYGFLCIPFSSVILFNLLFFRFFSTDPSKDPHNMLHSLPIVYGYPILMGLLLSFFFKFHNQMFPLMKIVCIYGYANLAFILAFVSSFLFKNHISIIIVIWLFR